MLSTGPLHGQCPRNACMEAGPQLIKPLFAQALHPAAPPAFENPRAWPLPTSVLCLPAARCSAGAPITRQAREGGLSHESRATFNARSLSIPGCSPHLPATLLCSGAHNASLKNGSVIIHFHSQQPRSPTQMLSPARPQEGWREDGFGFELGRLCPLPLSMLGPRTPLL